MTLTQKETGLLKDLMDQEKLCADKYSRHAACANDAQLGALFAQIANAEQQHLNTLTQLSQGAVPAPTGGGGPLPTFAAVYTADSPEKKDDAYLCSDVLAMEKHASSLYDTCIFEFADENARALLSGIQTQEQRHGKMIYDYMAANGMYC